MTKTRANAKKNVPAKTTKKVAKVTKVKAQPKKTTTTTKKVAAIPKKAASASTKKGGQKLLELGLLCDCTSSMWSWIDRAKKTLQEIISNVVSSTEGLKVRVSFIGYRDH